MNQTLENTFSVLDKVSIKFYNLLYTASIAKEVASSGSNNGGILVIGMIIVIVGLVGFIITKNSK